MSTRQTVLLLGGTGRTGKRVLRQLLKRGVDIRVVVRAAERLPAEIAGESGLAVLEADLLSLSSEELLRQVRGCDAVVSCLGHTASFRGIFGAPRDLVLRATARVSQQIEALQPQAPVKFILMSSVSVNHPGGFDSRSAFEKTVLWLLRGVVPPARDNQRAADFLYHDIGTSHALIQWVAVRPDTLLEGDESEYTVHERPVASLLASTRTNMANVAHFMCDLATSPTIWADWNGKLPVIINSA